MMFKVNVNGKEYQSERDMKLMDFLREELGILSVKNGCKEGACGTCTVIIDGKTVRSCVQKLSKLEGKKIQTIEGLSERQKSVFEYSFAAAGAVQCGFCIPGMVIAGKNLIDQNPSPTREEIKYALRNNICRCTGYAKIEDAILLAAKVERENLEIPEIKQSGSIGERVHRVDAKGKTLGTTKFADDFMPAGMLYGKNVFTKHPCAKILAIDTSEALKMPGVVAVYTAKDIPGDKYVGHLAKDQPGMIDIGEVTKFIGDTLALVVAENKEQAEAATSAVKVEYEVLTPVLTPAEAAAPGAVQVHGEGFMQFGNFRVPENNLLHHEKVKRGDAEGAIANSKFVVTGTFQTPPQEHAFMETETAVGIPDGDGVIVVTGDQGAYNIQHEIMGYLNLPLDKVRIQHAAIGGAFGGKEDLSVQHHAALCAYLLKRPVKVYFSRQESINFHPKRHAMELYLKVGCDENGILQGMKARITSDTGAFASLGGPVLQRACTHAGGPYNYQNVDIEGKAYYTNNPPAGAFRGFGVTQSVAGIECLVNQLAEKVGITGWEMRYRNAIKPGQVLPNGQFADEGTAMRETLEAVKEDFDKYEADDNYYVGISAAMKNAGLGVGVIDIGRTNLEVKDGKVHVRSGAAANGQGIHTVLMQMVAETTGLKPEEIVVHNPDTKLAPDSGMTTASRQTTFAGEAAIQAATQLKADLDEGKTLQDLEGNKYIGEFEFKTDPMGTDKPNPISHISYGFASELVVIDKEGKIVEVVAAHDVGRAINPLSTEGQIEGGIAMGLGFGLTENFTFKGGIPQNKLGTIGIIKSDVMPPVKSYLIEKNAHDGVAYGAKGIGEIVCCLAAPAAQNAYYKKDGVFRYKYPLDNTFYRKTEVGELAKFAPEHDK